jgi:hypothetical protein
MRFASEVTILALWATNQLDPRIALSILVHNFRRLIRRTVINYDPALRQHCLRDHGGEGLFNESFLIVRRSDQNVLHTAEIRD